MMVTTCKIAGVAVIGSVALGGLIFGSDLGSYAHTSWNSMQTSIKDSIPMEIELQRARDLLDQIIPEMRANIRVIAEEEVELENLRHEVGRADDRLANQRASVEHLRSMLTVEQASYRVNNQFVSRDKVRSSLARRFALLQEAQASVEAKKRLLTGRQTALDTAIAALEKTRSQKAELEAQIEALEAQHRLIQAASVGTGTTIDQSKLAQTDKLIGQIRKRLDVAEKTLAREGEFITDLTLEDTPRVDEASLLTEVDAYLGNSRLVADDTPRENKGTVTP